MKKIVLLSFIFFSQYAFADFYCTVNYTAHPKKNTWPQVYQKKLYLIKANDTHQAEELLKDDYVAFIKRNHPEYFQDDLTGRADDERLIRSRAWIACIAKKSDAQGILESGIEGYRDTAVVVDDYVYSGN